MVLSIGDELLGKISFCIRSGYKPETIDFYVGEYKACKEYNEEALNALFAQKMKGGKKDVDRRLFEKKTVELKEPKHEPKKSKSRRH
jgi:hypothetical protein